MNPAIQTTPEQWQLMINLNLSSAFLMAHAVLPVMLQNGTGKLIFVSSRSASQPAANMAAYAASKSGLDTMVQVLAEETRKQGINVNAVAPSLINTPTNRESMPNANHDDWVQPQSIAAVIQFLASEAARDVHGAVIPIIGRT
ncbi:MAG: SDR family oxidoreductase [Chloroflexaceae bacterium]|nr:SDR family oxidoreductase [Chloroflexaceae bacterium]